MAKAPSRSKKKCDDRDIFCRVQDAFHLFARKSASFVGSAWSFAGAVLIIIIWALTGPIFHYSDTWQLLINTSTTIVTFLMVFLIQNSQNREAKATQLKLDELIRAVSHARNNLLDLEKLTDTELDQLEEEFRALGRKATLRPTSNSSRS